MASVDGGDRLPRVPLDMRPKVWQAALCKGQQILTWTDVYGATKQEAAEKVHLERLDIGARLDGLEVAILPVAAPLWWMEKHGFNLPHVVQIVFPTDNLAHAGIRAGDLVRVDLEDTPRPGEVAYCALTAGGREIGRHIVDPECADVEHIGLSLQPVGRVFSVQHKGEEEWHSLVDWTERLWPSFAGQLNEILADA